MTWSSANAMSTRIPSFKQLLKNTENENEDIESTNSLITNSGKKRSDPAHTATFAARELTAKISKLEAECSALSCEMVKTASERPASCANLVLPSIDERGRYRDTPRPVVYDACGKEVEHGNNLVDQKGEVPDIRSGHHSCDFCFEGFSRDTELEQHVRKESP